MNKTVLVIGAAVVVVLGVWFLTSRNQGGADTKTMVEKQESIAMEQKQPAKTEDTTTKKDEGVMMAKGGQYAAYDASKIAFAQEGKVVLFFRASWCPSCRALDADIKKNLSQIPADVLILDVDYDKSADLKREYGVTYQHTLVQVDGSGKMIAKWSGSPELSDLLKEVK